MERQFPKVIVGLTVFDPLDIPLIVKAELSRSGRHLSFIKKDEQTGKIRVFVTVESESGNRHSSIRARVVRNIDEQMARDFVSHVSELMRPAGLCLAESPSSPEGEDTIIFRSQPLNPNEDYSRTPTPVGEEFKAGAVTAVTLIRSDGGP